MFEFEEFFRDIDAAEDIAPGAKILRAFALPLAPALFQEIERITAVHPFRRMETRGGFKLAAAMSNCGSSGWVSDRKGYRYQSTDPLTGTPWPPLPALFRKLAQEAAAAAGYPDFEGDACLINRYVPGTGMSLHQDRDEQDLQAPIVSLSLGLPIVFLFGGNDKSVKAKRIPLEHGDVVVWGGPSRLAFHGVAPLKEGLHPLLGKQRINLTFRKAFQSRPSSQSL